MPALSSASRAGDVAHGATAPSVPSTFSRWASFVLHFFRHSTISSDTTTEALSLPARPQQRHTSLRSEARRFLGREVRPLIEQGRLLDLAEVLRASKQYPNRLNETVSVDERNAAKVRSIIAERLLASMPEWLSVYHPHLSDGAVLGEKVTVIPSLACVMSAMATPRVVALEGAFCWIPNVWSNGGYCIF